MSKTLKRGPFVDWSDFYHVWSAISCDAYSSVFTQPPGGECFNHSGGNNFTCMVFRKGSRLEAFALKIRVYVCKVNSEAHIRLRRATRPHIRSSGKEWHRLQLPSTISLHYTAEEVQSVRNVSELVARIWGQGLWSASWIPHFPQC